MTEVLVMRRTMLVLCTVLMVSLGTPVAAVSPQIDPEPSAVCLDSIPPVATDLGGQRTMRLAIATDGILKSVAEETITEAERPYTDGAVSGSVPTGVRFEVVDVHSHSFTNDRVQEGVGVNAVERDDDLMTELVRHYRADHSGLVRDHVHLFTSKWLSLASTSDELDSVRGINNCQGSAGHSDVSYSISDHDFPGSYCSPIGCYGSINPKLAAHVIGHALGAQHVHSNCAEGLPELSERKTDPCTIMFNEWGLVGLRLGPAEALAISNTARGQIEP